MALTILPLNASEERLRGLLHHRGFNASEVPLPELGVVLRDSASGGAGFQGEAPFLASAGGRKYRIASRMACGSSKSGTREASFTTLSRNWRLCSS